jgi:hypothetical protein
MPIYFIQYSLTHSLTHSHKKQALFQATDPALLLAQPPPQQAQQSSATNSLTGKGGKTHGLIQILIKYIYPSLLITP